jgi:LacI family transcriptional regulator
MLPRRHTESHAVANVVVASPHPCRPPQNSNETGFSKSAAQSNIRPLLTQPGSFRQEAGYAAANALLDAPEPPTAIFAGNDLQAMGVYRALYERGLRVPDDMSVVGFDDLPLVALLTPALTTVRQPVRDMGALATRMLLRMVAGKPLESPRVELAKSLMVRESCAPPRPLE